MRRSLILVLALLAGLVTLMLLQLGRQQPTETAAPAAQSDAIHVLVFSRDLPRGTVIDDAGLAWQLQLRTAVPPEAIQSEQAGADFPETILGRLLRRDVLTGELVRPTNFVEGAAGFMALALSPGKRAVGIAVTPQKLAGGFILPDDRIDIIHTSSGDFDRDGQAGTLSQTILENIRVLAVGETSTSRITFQTADQQEAAETQKSDVNVMGETITLEMSETEAEVLFSAMSSGQVSLALRALDDHGKSRIVSTLGFEAAQSAPADVAPAQQGEDTRPPPPVRRKVRIIQGGTASQVEVPPGRGAR